MEEKIGFWYPPENAWSCFSAFIKGHDTVTSCSLADKWGLAALRDYCFGFVYVFYFAYYFGGSMTQWTEIEHLCCVLQWTQSKGV